MKRIGILTYLLTALLLVCSCDDDAISEKLRVSDTYKKLDVKERSLSCDYHGGELKLSIDASGVDWKFNGVPSWIELSPSKGNSSTDVKVTFKLNEGHERNGVFYLVSNEKDWPVEFPISVTQFPNQKYLIEAVDLGLSVKWASINVGATVPESYGSYYAWGETGTKTSYGWTNYKYRTGGNTPDDLKLSKYNYNSKFGTVDGSDYLDLTDDVAHVLLGGNWRIPTDYEFMELVNSCAWTWTSLNGVSGYRINGTKDGYRDRSVFLPASGSMLNSENKWIGNEGCYWSKSLSDDYPYFASYLMFDEGSKSVSRTYRMYGMSVRPVCPSENWPGITSVMISQNTLDVFRSDSAFLSATVISGNEPFPYAPIEWESDNIMVATVDDNGAIYAKSVGTATIKATCLGVSSECKVVVTEHDPVIEAVDLGLSVMWATCNVGAYKPEKYGDYFAWGETEYKMDNSSSYKYEEGSHLTKYCYNSDYGTVDSIYTLEAEDDVATVKWGGDWRMPTQSEFQELKKNCTIIWTTKNGVYGCLITSNIPGYSDSSIFLPAAGWRYDIYYTHGGECNYWSSSLSDDMNSRYAYSYYAYSYDYQSIIIYDASSRQRSLEFSVRPVYPRIRSVSIDNPVLELYEGEDSLLTANAADDSGPTEVYQGLINWASDNNDVATVDSYGKVTAVGQGTCNIICSIGSVSEKCKVTVKTLTVNLDVNSLFILSGVTYTLHSTLECDNNIVEKKIKWTSSDKTVAVVDDNGVVTTKNVGKCVVTASYGKAEARCSVTVIPPKSVMINSHEAVNMGLSVRWATCNVGADEPYKTGNYFSWGEVTTNSYYYWDTYKWCYNGWSDYLTKYCDSYSYGKYGYTDYKYTLDPEDDVASVLWGGNWRMPTIDEFKELWFNCTWFLTTRNDVTGYWIVSNKTGYSDRSIFLPVTGYRHMDYKYAEEDGFYYWTSSLSTISNPSYAFFVDFQDTSHSSFTYKAWSRYMGMAVRPVCP